MRTINALNNPNATGMRDASARELSIAVKSQLPTIRLDQRCAKIIHADAIPLRHVPALFCQPQLDEVRA